MQLSPSFFAHQTEALQFWSCRTSVLIFRDPTPPKSAGEPVQQAQAHPTSLKFRMPGAKVQHHPADIGFSSSFSTNAQGDAATDWRYIALTRGTHRPHSTQQASAIRPDASSKQRRGNKRFAVLHTRGELVCAAHPRGLGSGTCTRRLVHLRNEVGAPNPCDPLPAPSPVGVSKWKGRDWREAPGLFSQNDDE